MSALVSKADLDGGASTAAIWGLFDQFVGTSEDYQWDVIASLKNNFINS